MRSKTLTKQLVVRFDADLHDALVADAEANDRTVAQSIRRAVRFYLTASGAEGHTRHLARGSDPVTEG